MSYLQVVKHVTQVKIVEEHFLFLFVLQWCDDYKLSFCIIWLL